MLDMSQVSSIADEIANHIHTIALTCAGEAMVHPQFCEALDLLHRRLPQATFKMNTSGVTVGRNAERLLRYPIRNITGCGPGHCPPSPAPTGSASSSARLPLRRRSAYWAPTGRSWSAWPPGSSLGSRSRSRRTCGHRDRVPDSPPPTRDVVGGVVRSNLATLRTLGVAVAFTGALRAGVSSR
jgi:hypothetical protein